MRDLRHPFYQRIPVLFKGKSFRADFNVEGDDLTYQGDSYLQFISHQGINIQKPVQGAWTELDLVRKFMYQWAALIAAEAYHQSVTQEFHESASPQMMSTSLSECHVRLPQQPLNVLDDDWSYMECFRAPCDVFFELDFNREDLV